MFGTKFTVVKRSPKQFLSLFSTSPAAKPQEAKIKIGDWKINYLKVGRGPHNVLCQPGALGSIWTDFKPQVHGFDEEKFTVVFWDPPGYGFSRPPEKQFPLDFFVKDAKFAIEFMKGLEIPNYSLLGWSDGGIIAMLQAALAPERVNKLVVWGSNSFILPNELESYKKTRDIKTWSPRMREPMIEVYGEEHFAKLWADWVDGMENIYHAQKGDIMSSYLKDIKCETFILYGEKDPMVDSVHVSNLHMNIKKSRVHLYPEGKHNIHLRYADDFNKRVQDFLLGQ